MKTSNVILGLMGLFLLAFIVAMTVIFCVKGAVPDTLIQYTLGAGAWRPCCWRESKSAKFYPGTSPGKVRNHTMNETIIKRLGNLLSVKSLVTLALTVVFAVMTVRQAISQDFMTIYAVIIAFYFGTQSQKVQDIMENKN